jgi:hypothetical protein
LWYQIGCFGVDGTCWLVFKLLLLFTGLRELVNICPNTVASYRDVFISSYFDTDFNHSMLFQNWTHYCSVLKQSAAVEVFNALFINNLDFWNKD